MAWAIFDSLWNTKQRLELGYYARKFLVIKEWVDFLLRQDFALRASDALRVMVFPRIIYAGGEGNIHIAVNWRYPKPHGTVRTVRTV